MRISYVVLLAAVIQVASVQGSSVATESKMANPSTQFESVLTHDLRDMEKKRLLRAEMAIQEDDEERGAVADLVKKFKKLWRKKKPTNVAPKVETKIDPKVIAKAESLRKVESMPKNLVKIPDDLTKVKAMPMGSRFLKNQLDDLVTKAKSTDDAFSILKLGQKDPKKLFDPDALPMYVRYIERTAKNRGGQDMYGLKGLQERFSEKELMQVATMGLKRGDDLSVATAERLRAGLLIRWWREEKSATEVARLLKGGQMRVDKVNKEAASRYLDVYNRVYITGKKVAGLHVD